MKETLFLGITGWDILIFCITIGMLIAAAIIDKKTLKIPNYITFPGIVAGAALCAASRGFGEMGIRFIAVAVLFLFFMVRLLSGGDAKLLMAISLLQGILPMLLTLIIGNIVLLVVAFFKDRHEAAHAVKNGLFLMNGWTDTSNYSGSSRKIALAPYLLVGFLLYYVGNIAITMIF